MLFTCSPANAGTGILAKQRSVLDKGYRNMLQRWYRFKIRVRRNQRK